MSKTTENQKSVKKRSVSTKGFPLVPPKGYTAYGERRLNAYQVFKRWALNDDPYRNCFMGLVRAAHIEVKAGGDLDRIRKGCIKCMYRIGTGGAKVPRVPSTREVQAVYMYALLFDEVYDSMVEDEESWERQL